MKIFGKKSAKRVLASLSHDGVDQLCDLIIARLEERTQRVLASQARSRGFESHHPLHFNPISYPLALYIVACIVCPAVKLL